MRTDSREMLAVGIFGDRSRIGERVEMLVRHGRNFSARTSAAGIIAGLTALCVLVSAGSFAPRWIAFAQQAPRPSFEVASVKPGEPGSRRFGIGTRGQQFIATNAPLKMMIGFAYDVQSFQISGGPKWIVSDRFTINARPSAGIRMGFDREGTRMEKLMLESLLEERFKLAVHRETRTEPVYELVVAKGGPKLKLSSGPDKDGRQGIFGRGFGDLTEPIQSLVGILSQRLSRTVIDKTGLTGKYDFQLSFMSEPTPEDLELFGPVPPEEAPPADASLPSIFTALQDQIGLRLESARGPVEVVVVDRAEKPDAN